MSQVPQVSWEWKQIQSGHPGADTGVTSRKDSQPQPGLAQRWTRGWGHKGRARRLPSQATGRRTREESRTQPPLAKEAAGAHVCPEAGAGSGVVIRIHWEPVSYWLPADSGSLGHHKSTSRTTSNRGLKSRLAHGAAGTLPVKNKPLSGARKAFFHLRVRISPVTGKAVGAGSRPFSVQVPALPTLTHILASR